MTTYGITFQVVVDADDADDAIEMARSEYLSRDDFEPSEVVNLDDDQPEPPSEKIEVVLVIKDGDQYLLRGDARVNLTVLDYDAADNLIRSGAIVDDGTEWDGVGAPDHDASGEPFFRNSPTVICRECGDWIGDDEPRLQRGTGHEAVSYCGPCQEANQKQGLPL